MELSPDRTPIITARTLRDFLACARHPWLDAFGDPAQRAAVSPAVAPLYAIGRQHEARVHAATAVYVEQVPVTSWAEALAATRELMAQGVPGILGACFEQQAALDLTDRVFTLRGQVDRLVLVPWEGEVRYAPVEIKQRAQPVDEDWAQLDLYAWLVEQAAGSVAPGELWLGADEMGVPLRRLPHDYDEQRLLALLSTVAQTLDPATEPPVRIGPPCKGCRWYASCAAVAQGAGHLELLYNVSRKTREGLRAAGITSLAHVAALSAEELQRVRGIGKVTAPMIRANAQAWLAREPVWYNPLPEICDQCGWMFDLETLDNGQPWCLGWCDEDGNTQITLVAPVEAPQVVTLLDGQTVTLAPHTDSAWRVFAASAAVRPGPIYHWTGYDSAIMRSTAPPDVIDRLMARMHDLHGTVKRSVSFPLGSTSIKVVAAYLGYPWPGYNDWFAAFLDYREWLHTGSLDALTRACMYQRADVESMAWVWRWMVQDGGLR